MGLTQDHRASFASWASGLRTLTLSLSSVVVICGLSADLFAQSETSPFGVVSAPHVGNDPNPDPPLERYTELGIGWVRVSVDWDEIQPTSEEDWEIEKAERLAERLTSAGLNIYWDISYAPCWANGSQLNSEGKCLNPLDRRRPPLEGPPNNPYASYRAFITRLVNHMKTRGVKHWGTWNEVNSGSDGVPFYNVPGSPRERVIDYATKLLPVVVNAIRSADPTAKIVVGELTNREGGDQGWGSAVDDVLIFLGFAPAFDMASVHVYHGDDTCGGRISFMDYLHGRLSAIPQLPPNLPLWVTETGLSPPLAANTEDLKGAYIRCIMTAMIPRSHWWKKNFYYRMEWEPPTVSRFGLLGQNDERLGSWYAYQDHIAGLNNPPDPPEPNLPVPPHPAEDDLPTIGVRFEWFPSSGAHHYHLRVERPDSSLVLNAFPTEPFYETGHPSPLVVGGTYKWIVKAINDAGGDSPWSGENYFQVVPEFTHLPAAQPVTAGPIGCIGTRQPTFHWSYSPAGGMDATAFEMNVLKVIDATGNNDQIVFASGKRGGTQLELPLTLESGQQYRWNVRGLNSVGKGPMSAQTYFTPECAGGLLVGDAQVVEGAAGGNAQALVPVILSPTVTHTVTVNYATSNGTAVAGVDYVATSGTLTFNPGQGEGVIPVPILGDALDEPHETFTVTLSNAVGSPIADGQAQVTIIDDDNPPLVPSAPAPAVGATVTTPTPTLSWTGGDPDEGDVVRYDVYLGWVAPLQLVATNLTAPAFQTAELLRSKTYSWQVVARDIAGNTTFGPVWQFLTPASFPPRIPSNPDPADGAEASTALPTMAWSGGDPDPGDAVVYDVYMGDPNAPRTLPQVATGLSQPVYKPALLRSGWTYRWKVVARDQTGLSSTGPEWTFKVATTPGCSVISTVPFTITQSGRYCLDRDWTTGIVSGQAIRILADDVLIDLGGFTLAGTGGLGTIAYGVTTQQANRRNVTVRNGTIRGFFVGVFLGPGEGHYVERVKVNDSTYVGIWLHGRGSVRRCEVSNTGGSTHPTVSSLGRHGIVLYAQGSTAIDNTVVDTGTPFDVATCYGIYVWGAHRSIIEGNRVGRSLGSPQAGRKGIFIYGAESVTAVRNRLTYLDVGIEYSSGGSGPYRDNVATECQTSYIGGTNAGNNF